MSDLDARIFPRARALVGAALLLPALFGSTGCNQSPGGSSLTAADTDDDTGQPATSTAPADSSDGGSSSGEDATTEPPPKYDVAAIPDAPPPFSNCNDRRGGGGGGRDPLYSYIWISNSTEGTVSKIDTITMVELGRYRTHPNFGDPSRTSVSLNGNVAVANRNGGVAKFWANPADCEDRNGDGQIQTSTGPQDVLPWDDEECRAWFTPFDYSSQRPVAWTSGQWDPDACAWVDEKVWTSGASDGGFGFPGKEPEPGDGFTGVRVILIDGDSGTVDYAVKIPEVVPGFYGIYGGAVDANNDFWGSQLSIGDLVHVDLDTMEYDLWPMAANGYGMTVGASGYVWTCSGEVGRFDPETEQWDTAYVGGGGGCMEDANGILWMASSPLVGVDVETLQVVYQHNLPEYVHGVSIDFQGYVWGVSMMGSNAYRVDPMTGDFDTVSGLVGPYTYSDMTGFALAGAGGWTPTG